MSMRESCSGTDQTQWEFSHSRRNTWIREQSLRPEYR